MKYVVFILDYENETNIIDVMAKNEFETIMNNMYEGYHFKNVEKHGEFDSHEEALIYKKTLRP